MTLERKTFSGRIARGDEAFAVDFHGSAGADFRLKIEVDPLPNQTLFRLQSAMGDPGSYAQSLLLEGEASDGAMFFSERVEVRAAKFGSSGNDITVSALKATVTVLRSGPILRPVMRLWLRSFKSHRNPIVPTSLGKMEVWGNHNKVPKDEVFGSIAIQADETTDRSYWRARADDFLTFMHRGLAFAHGSLLQTPRLDIHFEDCCEATFYDGNAFGPGLPPIHHLNHGPFLKAFAARYDDEKPFPDMLWTAIGWLQSDTAFDEGRFLTSMTALEAIVEHLIPKTLTTIVPKPEFSVVRDQLLDVVESSSLAETAREILKGRIKGLNGRSLSQKIEALRDYYGLSAKMFDNASIAAMIKLRNDIVHTGTAASGDFWPNIVFVRELVSHIMFHEVGYTGPYESYRDGYKMVHAAMTVGEDSAAGGPVDEGADPPAFIESLPSPS